MSAKLKTVVDFSLAGKVCDQAWFSDDELEVAIDATDRVLSYLDARGDKWRLATSLLRMELERMKGWRNERELARKRNKESCNV